MELLVASARLALTTEDAARLRDAARRVRDWDAVVGLAQEHRVLPFVARHVAAHAVAEVDATVIARLHDAALEIAARALAAAGELVRVLGALEAAGVRSLPYKGPALALAAYGDAGVRDCEDLDFVVTPRDLGRARDVFHSLGYRQRAGMSRAQEGAIYGGQGHFPYVREGRFVELHWRFCATRFPWNPPLVEIVDRCTSVELAGARIAVPAREDQLLLLLLHGTRHLWERLEWVTAVSELLRGGAVDGPALLARATATGGRRAVLVGLAVARELLGAPVPEVLAAEIARDGAVESMAQCALARAFDVPSTGSARKDERAYYVRCLERPADRLRFLLQSTLRPTPREWEVVRLPGALTALYVPIRLARLATRRLRSSEATR